VLVPAKAVSLAQQEGDTMNRVANPGCTRALIAVDHTMQGSPCGLVPETVAFAKGEKTRWTVKRSSANGWLMLIAIGALTVGALVYMLDRPAATAYLLPGALSFSGGHHPVFGALGGHLPEFVHVYAFILLTVAISPWPARVLPVCGFWWAVDSLFEIGQHPVIAPTITAALPNWFRRIPILDHIANYFLRGTSDPADLVAVALGTVSAYLTIRLIRKSEVGHATDTQIRS